MKIDFIHGGLQSEVDHDNDDYTYSGYQIERAREEDDVVTHTFTDHVPETEIQQ